MGAADLDHIGEFFRLGLYRFLDANYGWDEILVQALCRCKLCIAVGNASFEDCDILTSSLG